MMAALLAAALWLNTATYVGAPVSTTHSIVGGVMGAGIAAGGVDIVSGLEPVWPDRRELDYIAGAGWGHCSTCPVPD